MADLETKEKKSKKNKGKALTHRNFGAFLDIGKVKSAQHLSLAWRCRLLDNIPYNTWFLFWVETSYVKDLS